MNGISSILGAAALRAGCALSEGTAPIGSSGGPRGLQLVHANEVQLGGGVFSPDVQSTPPSDSMS